jgi:hypothetical protein
VALISFDNDIIFRGWGLKSVHTLHVGSPAGQWAVTVFVDQLHGNVPCHFAIREQEPARDVPGVNRVQGEFCASYPQGAETGDISAEPHARPILNLQLVLVVRAIAIWAGEANLDSPKNIARLNIGH